MLSELKHAIKCRKKFANHISDKELLSKIYITLKIHQLESK